MSELKTYFLGKNNGIEFAVYLKSEADKVIEELKEKITRLENIRRVHIEAVTSMEAGLQQEAKSIRHSNYKRCLAMAKWCNSLHQFHETIERKIWLHKWENRWLKLAEKFKEAK